MNILIVTIAVYFSTALKLHLDTIDLLHFLQYEEKNVQSIVSHPIIQPC